jgi:hypothetical protein
MRVIFKNSVIKIILRHKIDLTFEFHATETKNPLSKEGIYFFSKHGLSKDLKIINWLNKDNQICLGFLKLKSPAIFIPDPADQSPDSVFPGKYLF